MGSDFNNKVELFRLRKKTLDDAVSKVGNGPPEINFFGPIRQFLCTEGTNILKSYLKNNPARYKNDILNSVVKPSPECIDYVAVIMDAISAGDKVHALQLIDLLYSREWLKNVRGVVPDKVMG